MLAHSMSYIQEMIRGHYEYCTETTQVCRDIHMACKVNTCVCTTGYKYDNYIGRCIPVTTTHLGDSCVTVNDCYQTTSDPNCECGTVLVLSKLKKKPANATQPQCNVIKYFAIFKSVAHSLEPGETPSYSASLQAPNYVQRS